MEQDWEGEQLTSVGEEQPHPRDVMLYRHPEFGFGFVAGSQKPVVVRFVTDEGPCDGQLEPGDHILFINGEDVSNAPREYVINLVRSCKDSIVLTVCQPFTDNGDRKSAFISAAKKARLKHSPTHVRFADSVAVNGSTETIPLADSDSVMPFMPNVLRVFMENGQTKSFMYDETSTVKDVVGSLQTKLGVSNIEHFALVLQDMKSPQVSKMVPLQDQDKIVNVAARPDSCYVRCLFRVTYFPKDSYDLLRKDMVAFDYLYMQCCNDVVNGRLGSELKFDLALRLAALHLHQYAIDNNIGKITLKHIEEEVGLDKFIPVTLLQTIRHKDIRRRLSHFMKYNQNLTAPGQKQITSLQAKIHYMKILSEGLKSFGAKCFLATFCTEDKRNEIMLMVGPHCGISQFINIKLHALSILADFEDIASMALMQESDSMQRLHITLKESHQMAVILLMMIDDMRDFLTFVLGYYMVLIGDGREILDLSHLESSVHSNAIASFYRDHNEAVVDRWNDPDEEFTEPINGSDPSDALAEALAEFERAGDFAADSSSSTEDADSTSVSSNITMPNYYEDSTCLSPSCETISVSSQISRSSLEASSPTVVKTFLSDDKTMYKTQGDLSMVSLDVDMKNENETDSISSSSIDLSSEESLQIKTSARDSLAIHTKKPYPIMPSFERYDESEYDDTDILNYTNREVEDRPTGTVLDDDSSDVSSNQQITESFGLHNIDQFLHEDPTLDPRLFSNRGLYLDPDIIDLTMLSALTTGCENNEADLTTDGFPTESNHQAESELQPDYHDLLSSPYSSGEANSDSAIESESKQQEPEEDFDALIARLTVPPPPGDADVVDGADFAIKQENTVEAKQNNIQSLAESGIEELIIPPPPSCKAISIDNIAIVPPFKCESPTPLFSHTQARNDTCHTNRNSSPDLGQTGMMPTPVLHSSRMTPLSDSRKFESPNYDLTSAQPKQTERKNIGPLGKFRPPLPPKQFSQVQNISDLGKEKRLLRSLSAKPFDYKCRKKIPPPPPPRKSSISSSVVHSVATNLMRTIDKFSEESIDKKNQPTNDEAIYSNLAEVVGSMKIDSEPVYSQYSNNTIPSNHVPYADADSSIKTGLSTDKPDILIIESSNTASSFAYLPASTNKAKTEPIENKTDVKSLKQHFEGWKSQGPEAPRLNQTTVLGKTIPKSITNIIQKSNQSNIGPTNELVEVVKTNTYTTNSPNNKNSRLSSPQIDCMYNTRKPLEQNVSKPLTESKPSSLDIVILDSKGEYNERTHSESIHEQTINKANSDMVNSHSMDSVEPRARMVHNRPVDSVAPNTVIVHSHPVDSVAPNTVAVHNRPVDSSMSDSWTVNKHSTDSVTPGIKTVHNHIDSRTIHYRPTDSVAPVQPRLRILDTENDPKPMSWGVNGIDYSKSKSSWRINDTRRHHWDAPNEIHAYPREVNSIKPQARVNKDDDDVATDDEKKEIAKQMKSIIKNVSSPENAVTKKVGFVDSVQNSETTSCIHIAEEISKRVYSGDQCFTHADDDVDTLINAMETFSEITKTHGTITEQDIKSQEKLTIDARQFVTDSKLLVSSATQAHSKLTQRLNASMHTLAKICISCCNTVSGSNIPALSANLIGRVLDVAKAYRTTLYSAHLAAGKPLSDPLMKQLMKQATSLAGTLSALMKTLKVLESY